MNLIFIGALGFGIVCSALTTVIAEAASALLCILYVCRKIPLLRLNRGEFKADMGLLKKTLSYGGITALQQSCRPIAKLLIQGAVNPFGVNTMAAFNAVNRIDDYVYTPEQNLSQGVTTFIAQNRGGGRKNRIKKVFKKGLLPKFGYWIFIALFISVFKESPVGLFVTGGNGEIIETGCSYLTLMTIFCVLPTMTNAV